MDALQAALSSEVAESFAGLAGAPLKAIEKTELLPLDSAARMAVFRSGGKTYRHAFRRFAAADWDSFFVHVVAEFKREKGGFMQVVDMDYASLVLYARAIQRVDGYQTRDGRAPHELPTWPECIPQHHRLAAMGLVMNVTHSEAGDDSMLEAESVPVTIDAMWNEDAPGAMKQYRGLVHHFASPTAEHRRRLLKAKNRAFVAGGSRNGTTVIPSGHGVLVKLYDDLIERVDGYSIAGRALAGKEEIVREMDAFHKSAVVARLFQTSAGIDEENAETE
jgi:hypothetical protein